MFTEPPGEPAQGRQTARKEKTGGAGPEVPSSAWPPPRRPGLSKDRGGPGRRLRGLRLFPVTAVLTHLARPGVGGHVTRESSLRADGAHAPPTVPAPAGGRRTPSPQLPVGCRRLAGAGGAPLTAEKLCEQAGGGGPHLLSHAPPSSRFRPCALYCPETQVAHPARLSLSAPARAASGRPRSPSRPGDPRSRCVWGPGAEGRAPGAPDHPQSGSSPAAAPLLIRPPSLCSGLRDLDRPNSQARLSGPERQTDLPEATRPGRGPSSGALSPHHL